MIIAGQGRGGDMQLLLVSSEGNLIEAIEEPPYTRIGAHEFGKPIRDRVARPDTSLADAQRRPTGRSPKTTHRRIARVRRGRRRLGAARAGPRGGAHRQARPGLPSTARALHYLFSVARDARAG